MNATDAIEVQARRFAANLTDPSSRTVLTAQLADAVALLTGVEQGLHTATPDGHEVACMVDSQLGAALAALQSLAVRVVTGNLFEPTFTTTADSDLVDDVAPLYALTSDGIAAIRASGFQAGLNAREVVSA